MVLESNPRCAPPLFHNASFRERGRFDACRRYRVNPAC
jgi:hypothetical protein